ncbi:MAG: MTAP family purine nucleoside phosphorylase [Planctomycetes bacterium]|nr:MTAP family purine nucleoside phosphorylase [Planctomycetota bacterium]
MSPELVCIAGEEVHRQLNAGRLQGRRLPPHQTPFGPSGEIIQADLDGMAIHIITRHGEGIEKVSQGRVNYRANIYAAKSLKADCILAWGAGGTISHSIGVGDLVLLEDLIDMTSQRPKTFFEDRPLGFLRQFPLFCPTLRAVTGQVLQAMNIHFHDSAVAAVFDGPRMETAAEVRMMSAAGANVVTHTFAPEAFLAKELQMCYAAVCYVVSYAETGSRYKPIMAGDLFGGQAQQSTAERLTSAVSSIGPILARVAKAVKDAPKSCECDQPMAANIYRYGIGEDWRKWFV